MITPVIVIDRLSESSGSSSCLRLTGRFLFLHMTVVKDERTPKQSRMEYTAQISASTRCFVGVFSPQIVSTHLYYESNLYFINSDFNDISIGDIFKRETYPV